MYNNNTKASIYLVGFHKTLFTYTLESNYIALYDYDKSVKRYA